MSVDVVAIHPRGDALAAGCTKCPTAQIWDLRGGRWARALALHEHGAEGGAIDMNPDAINLRWSSDGRYLATVSSTRVSEVRVWDGDKQLIHHQQYRNVAAEFSPNGKRLLLVGGLGDVDMIRTDVPSAAPVSGLHGAHQGTSPPGMGSEALLASPVIVWSPSGDRAAIVESGTIFFLDGAAARPRRVAPKDPAEDPMLAPSQIAWSPDGARFAIVYRAGSATVHRTATAARERVLREGDQGDGFWENGIVWGSRGVIVAVARRDGISVASWDPESGKSRAAMMKRPGGGTRDTLDKLSQLAFSTDSRRLLATYEHQGRAELWNLDDGALLAEHQDTKFAFFSPTGTRYVRDAKAAELRDGENGALLASFPAGVKGVAWRSDGSIAAVASSGLTLVRASDGTHLRLETYASDSKQAWISYAPDGTYAGDAELAACILGPTAKATASVLADFAVDGEKGP